MSPIPERILSKVAVNPHTGCWEWAACTTANGYGRVSFEGRPEWAHRATYRLAVGPIPEGYYVDHLCRNRRCVNPAHLEAVPPAVNTARGKALERRSETAAQQQVCKRGHPLSGDNLRMNKGRRVCKTCSRLYQRQYAEANPERVRAQSARYYRKKKADVLLELANHP